MDQGKGYTTVESIKIPGRIYLFRSDEEVASILAEVSMQVEVEEERQLSAACDLECESHSDSVSLCSINVDDNQTWCSEGNSSESSAASDDDDVPLQPFLSTGPLCIIARRKPMSGKKRKRQSRNPASEDYFEGTDIIGDKEPAEQGSEPGQPQRSAKKHRRFSADDDAYIYNQVNNRTEERLYQLWHRLGEHFGCSAAAVSCRWRNHLRYRSDNATASVIGTALPPSSATTSSNAVSSSRVVPVRSSGTILATAPNNAPALDEHATTTVAPLPLNSKSFSATALVIEQYYPHAFNHGSLEAADLEYLLCCVYLHLRDHGGADTLCELWLQLGAEFGVSVWNFLSMWKTFLKKTFDTYKSYWNQAASSEVPVVGGAAVPMTTSAGVSQSIVLDLLSLTVHSADIVQRVQDWGGRGRGLWTALATEFDCTPCQVMRLWSAMQLTAPVPAPPVQTLVSEPVPAPVLKPISQPVSEPVSDVFPTHGAKSSSSSASGAHLPLTVRPMLNLSPQELCVTVNAMRLFAETLGADLVTYLAAKLRKPEFEIRVALLCLTRDNLQLCESQIATKWYYKHFTEGNLSDARLVRTVIQCAAENNGFVSWGEVAVRVAVAPSALRLQWEIHLVRSAKLLYGILRDSAASAAASALDRSSAGPIHSAAEGTRSSSSGGGSSRSENPSAAAPSTTCAPITSTHDTTTAAAVATPSSSTTESAPLKSPADVEKTVTGAAAAAAEEGKVDAADVCSALGDMVTAVELHLATSTRGSPNLGPASLRSPTLAYMSAFRTMKQCEKRLKKIKGKQERPVKPRVPKVHTKCQRDDIESLLSAMDLPSSAANTKKKRDKSGKGKGKGNSEKEKRQYAKSRSLTEAERLSAKECIMEKRPGAPMKPLIKDLARRFGRSVLVMRMFLASLLRANSSLRDHLASGPLLGTPEAVTSLSQSQSLSHGSNAHLPLATNAVQNTPTTVQPNAPLIVPSEHSKRTDRELITALLCNASERQGKVNWLNLDIVRGVKRGASRARWLAALEGKVVVLYRHLRGIAKKQARVESAAAVSAATPSSSTSAAPSSGVCTGAANKAFSPSFVGSFDAQSAAAVASSARMETAAPVALSAHPAPPVHVATDCVVGCSTTRFAAARVSTGAPSGSAKESVSPTVPRPALDSAAFTEREVVQRVLGHIATAVELANFRGMTNESLGLPPRPKVNPYAPSKLRPTIQKVLNGMIKEVVHRQAKAAPSSSSASAAATASTGAGVGGEGALSIHAKAPRTGKVYNPNTTYKVRRAIQGLLEQMVKAVESAGTLHTTVHKPILQKRRFTEEEDAVILQYVRDALAAHKKINWADVDQQCGRQKSVTYIRWKYTLAAKYPELCSAKLGTAALKATPRKGSGPVASQPVLAMEEAVVATAGSSSSSQAALAGAEGDGDGGSGDRVSGGINGRGFGGEDSPQQSAAVRKTVASILGVIVQVVEMAAALRDETDGGLQR